MAVTDVILSNSDRHPAPCWLRCLLRAAGIPSCNLWTESQYVSSLEELGFENIKIKRLGAISLQHLIEAMAIGKQK